MDIQDLRQGDVLRGGRAFFQTGEERVLVKHRKGYGTDRHPSAARRTQVWAMPASLCDMAVLTQTCDIRKLDYLSLAPVFPITYGLSPEKQGEVRRQRITYLCHLPELSDGTLSYPEGYVDARIVCAVSKKAVASFEMVRQLPLGYREHLRKFVFNHYGRPAIPDDILRAMKGFLERAQDAKLRDQIHSLYINQNKYPFPVLVVLTESSPAAVEKLDQAIKNVNEKQADCLFAVIYRTYMNVKLSELDGYTRLVYDHLSYQSPSGLVTTDMDGYSLR